MTRFDRYPAGVPCFVETITDDLPVARSFYGGVFGWEFIGPGPTPGDPPGEYFVARVSGMEVAGVGRLGGACHRHLRTGRPMSR
jgi:predicted enzyme related to lactoylglutathione lyase